MSHESLSNYVHHMVNLIKDQAINAKRVANEKDGKDAYREGELMAYYSVISTLKNHVPFYGLEQKDLGLSDINPEADLLGLHERKKDS